MTTTRTIAPASCAQCLGFEVIRPATCTANYAPESQDAPMGAEELLCDSCARNWAYCNIRPLPAPEVAPEAPSPYAPWFRALLDQDAPCTDPAAFEAKAYRGMISYNISMTDGYYAPEAFDHWVIFFRLDPIGALYHGNDARSRLAPQAKAYIAR